ncbi:General secretion pathway protein L [Candidatus Methylobacter favarea]|uniref:General secretion pathway protein L n=1 Tax=Candidatus Methylobacter favarea TaxID=2707345 RepID=A0A8S0X9E2_9GAMM|nr:PilN domain-containing protein [Candidatus Methylobacter favarea]CAA9892166.1 General secretion pathway protein L [Candidatus Methylobacter favarea]
MLNLNSTIDLEFKKFFRWWKRELAFLVPEKIKQLVNDRHGFIIMRPQNNHLELVYLLDGQIEDLGKLDRNEAGIAQYKALLATDERLPKANLIIRLSGQDAIQKELALPAVAKENLQQVVAYEIDRYTPFKAEDVYFAVKPLEVISESGQIRVMLVLTTRQMLNALYEDLKAMEIAPLFVDYEGSANDLAQNDEYYTLLPEWLRQKTAKTPRLIHSALAGAVFLMLAAAIGMPTWFEYRAVNELQAKINTVEKEAKNVKALQLEIDAMIDETRKLINEKNAAPPVVVMLNTLSALIKDDTWLSYAQYSDGHLQMQGESPAASALIAVLEASELFANARFVSPVTQDKSTGLERFQITVDITAKRGAGDNT